MNNTTPKVDALIRSAQQWQSEMAHLRAIALECELTEGVKWRWPCYTSENRNIVLIHTFKEHCALLFFKGALLKDPKGILVKPGENTQAGRQARFTSLREIIKLEPTLKAYIREAIEVEKAGLKVELKKTADFAMPEELESTLTQHPALKTAFYALTPGRQRAYILYFSSAKQSATRASRVEKCTPQILAGKGLND